MGSLETPPDAQVLVVGAGIAGLTTALILKEHGYRVKIVARDLPSDTESQDFASPWAGASWDSFATEDDLDAQRREIKTYRKFEELLDHLDRSILIRAPNTVMLSKGEWEKIRDHGRWFSDKVKDFRLSSEGEAPSFSYMTFFMSVPLYTKWILSRLSTTPNPVEIQRISSLSSLSSALKHHPSASLVINATGLGSKTLSEIQDHKLFPIRGQTVLVKTPEFSKAPRGVTSRDGGIENLAYVIPRASSGTTILGGTYMERSNDELEDEATTERILKRCSEICPDLVPAVSQKAEGPNESDHQLNSTDIPEPWRRIEVERINVGFRPYRESGPRIELDKELKLKSIEGRDVQVLHCYGLGPAGYQTSWGIAEEVLGLVQEILPLLS